MTALFEGLTLLLLNSNVCKDNWDSGKLEGMGITLPETCSIDTGAKMAISAMVFFFAAGVASFLAHGAKKRETETGVDAGLSEPLAP